ncbi:barstar family protein [Streptantibioticus rubrisoli]|uniref:Barstar family protein n=1 Tax=Streptantibioticus rubrisoli TaxID=1387313 RepID=A0ABT1PFM0_9ACTN|nr:barstar family protein [Streptantibioticus rubrisoli]MCQ4044169.1 barstar family protein [Streptantibioticus rubrisoli]
MTTPVPEELSTLLARTGVVHWSQDRPTADLLAAAERTGRRAYSVELQGVADKAGFMARCAAALKLPDWFGANWDALYDCLTDPDVLPADGGRVLVVTGWHGYAAAAPEDWRTALGVLGDAADYWAKTDTQFLAVLVEPELTAPAHPTPGTSG